MKRTPHSMRYSAAEFAVVQRAAEVLAMPPSTFARVATVTLAREIIDAVDAAYESLSEHHTVGDSE